MELVYLWVENYKNIHKQGFNFSSKFICDYNGETLTIKDNVDEKGKKQYIENFFGDNINVTAIVGKNGSGKSSVREVLEDIIMSISLDENLGYLFFFMHNEKKCYIENIGFHCVDKDSMQELETIPFSFLTYIVEMPYPYFESNHLTFSNNYAISFETDKIVEKIVKYLDDTFMLTTFMLIPKKIYIEQDELFLEKLIYNIEPLIVPRSNNSNNGIPLEDCHNEREKYSTDNVIEAFMFEKIVKNDLAYYLCEKNFYDPKYLSYNNEVLEIFFNDDKYELNEEKYSLKEFNTLLQKKVFDKNTLTENDNKLIQKYSKFLKCDFEDAKGRKYNNLSHGEKSIFGQFLSIYDELNTIDKNLLIYLDEPDLSLHPNWQKRYLNELSNTFFDSSKNIHFIFTTHSPFLLSDIPKQNIIFLDTYEDGKCKVLKYDEVMNKKQTFGANIHTLLSDSFFMDDGLMGEFAKGKINEIIELHKIVAKEKHKKCLKKIYNKRKKNLWQTQSIIGEEYLKQVIKNHLVEIEKILLGKDMAKEEEIARTEVYLESLKNA